MSALLLCGCQNIPQNLLRTTQPEQQIAESSDFTPEEKSTTSSTQPISRPEHLTFAADPTTRSVNRSGLELKEFELDSAQVIDEITFQSGDTVKVSVWGYPELDHITQIQPNGTVTLPLTGEVLAAGKTAAQLRQSISNHLAPFTTINSFHLRSGDTITALTWQHPDLSHTSIIDPEGNITLPLIGQIAAAGRNINDIRDEAQKKLKKYIRDAHLTLIPEYHNRRVLHDHQVSVLAQQLQPRRVAIIGEVGVQGLTAIEGSLTLVEALAATQLQEKTAKLDSIVIIRDSMTSTPTYQKLDLKAFFAGKAPDQNIYLKNGDVIIVPKTTITKVGDFVDLFFSRTLPVFSWWTALHQASSARASSDSVDLINQSLKEQLDIITINP